jgi:hypothetical protein
MNDDLIARLRAMSRHEHDDATIGDEASDALEAQAEQLEVAESALIRHGYRKSCDIPACNCGDQWNHGGNAAMRLREFSEEMSGAGFNGGTLLSNLKMLIADKEAQAKRIEELQAAMTRWMEAVDKWLASGEAANPDESRSIYEQARAALGKPNV